jgi:hypothetical protein
LAGLLAGLTLLALTLLSGLLTLLALLAALLALLTGLAALLALLTGLAALLALLAGLAALLALLALVLLARLAFIHVVSHEVSSLMLGFSNPLQHNEFRGRFVQSRKPQRWQKKKTRKNGQRCVRSRGPSCATVQCTAA